MAFCAYKARNAQGELLTGVMEGADSGAVADQLMAGETLRRHAVQLVVQGRTTISEAMRISNQNEE